MSPLRPYTIARFGIYVAAAVAALSVWLGTRAGMPLDYSLLRSVFFFVIIAGLGFGAEAVLLLTPPIPPAPAQPPATEPTENLESE
ncbi:MAG: hypothetical protein AB7J35_15465 [Dehalococcoidia bacterium]